MIKKNRTYLQKNPNTNEAINHMVETFIDKSLNIFLVNEYSKPILQDENKKVTKLGWTLQATHAFNKAESALTLAKELVEEDMHKGFSISGERQEYYSTKNEGYQPTRNTMAYLIEDFAQHMLTAASTNPEINSSYTASARYKKYLLERASQFEIDEATLTKRAKVYIESVGLELRDCWNTYTWVKTRRPD